jgi:hypothetical protein
MATGWRVETLHKSTGAADVPIGKPAGGVFLPRRGVVFRTADGKLRAVVEGKDGVGSGWMGSELVTGVQAIGDPVGLVLTKTERCVTTVISRHIFFLANDGDIHELKSPAAADKWVDTDIVRASGANIKPAKDTCPSAYADPSSGAIYVAYRGVDQKIHELCCIEGKWKSDGLSKIPLKAAGDPVGCIMERQGTRHIAFRGDNGSIVELIWSKDRWRPVFFAKEFPFAPAPGSDPLCCCFPADGGLHIVYTDANGGPQEVWQKVWQKEKGVRLGSFPLANPFPDDIGPLAAPFFYEAKEKPHTFFVEPFVVETAVHEWTEWIVTTSELQLLQLPDLQLMAINPDWVKVKASDFSIIQTQKPAEKFLFKEGVLMRTSKGIVGSSGDPRISIVAGGKTGTVVDVRMSRKQKAAVVKSAQRRFT